MQDVIHDLQVIEQDVIDVEQKCEKVNCKAFYDAVIATIKLIFVSRRDRTQTDHTVSKI
jgi:hypothetical protein